MHKCFYPMRRPNDRCSPLSLYLAGLCSSIFSNDQLSEIHQPLTGHLRMSCVNDLSYFNFKQIHYSQVKIFRFVFCCKPDGTATKLPLFVISPLGLTVLFSDVLPMMASNILKISPSLSFKPENYCFPAGSISFLEWRMTVLSLLLHSPMRQSMVLRFFAAIFQQFI